MSKNTDGIIELGDTQTNLFIGGMRIARCDFDGVLASEAVENARRLRACWNACEGIETEKLEKSGPGIVKLFIKTFRDVMEAAISQNRGIKPSVESCPHCGATPVTWENPDTPAGWQAGCPPVCSRCQK